MPPPRKHHYIPEFLLRGWVGSDDRLERYIRYQPGNIHRKRCFVSEVGFEENLYDLAPVPDNFPGLEAGYFQKVDDRAAKVRAVLLRDHEVELSNDQRCDWTRFLMSILYRTPEALRSYKIGIERLLKTGLPDVEERWREVRASNDPEKFFDYCVSADPHYVQRRHLTMLPASIENESVGNFIANMKWDVLHTGKADWNLLVSDSPLAMSNGLKKTDGHLAIALSKDRLFLATYSDAIRSQILHSPCNEVVRRYNTGVAHRADRFIAAVDDSQARFIRNRYGLHQHVYFDYSDSDFTKAAQKAISDRRKLANS